MRFYDYMRRDKKQTYLMEKIKGLPIFICDDIASYYQGLSNEEWKVEDFPVLSPPYRHVWLDYHISKQDQDPLKVRFPEQFAIYCSWREPDEVQDEEMQRPETIAKFRHWVNTFHPKWVLSMAVFWRIKDRNHGPLWSWTHLIDDQGALMFDEDKEIMTMHGPLNEGIYSYIEQMIVKEHLTREEASDELYQEFVAFLHVGALTLSFLNAKNTDIQEHQEGAFTPRTRAQKKRGEKPLPAITYKTLVITAIKKALTAARSETGAQGSKALHFVRGHFHEYTADKPLFGRDGLVGKFFIAMHTRGNANNGVVVKDYELRKD